MRHFGVVEFTILGFLSVIYANFQDLKLTNFCFAFLLLICVGMIKISCGFYKAIGVAGA